MTQADVLYFFPQLCRNQPSIWMSENCRTVTLLGAQHDDIQRQFHMPWTAEMNADEEAVGSLFPVTKSILNPFFLGPITPRLPSR